MAEDDQELEDETVDQRPPRASKRPKPANELTLADIKRRKKGRIAKVTIQLDGEVAAQLEELREKLQEAKAEQRVSAPDMGTKDKVAVLAREIEQMVESARDSEATFVFKAMGRRGYDELVSKHPPKKADRDIAKRLADETGQPHSAEFDSDSFPPALIAASSLEPLMSETDAIALWNDPDWNGAELIKLFNTALMVNSLAGDIPFGLRGIGVTPSTGSKSTTATKPESPGRSSSAE